MAFDRSLPTEVLEALESLASSGVFQPAVVRRYDSGEFGAYRLTNVEGQSVVLKLSRQKRAERAKVTTDILHARGYPVPRYLHIGDMQGDRCYVLMDELPGSPISQLTLDQLPQVFQLIEMQVGAGVFEGEERLVIETLISGGDGYALHETMKLYSPETASLLETIVSVGQTNLNLDLPVNDIVHHDFHTGNMLVDGAEISGVLDWDGTHSGDVGFDIATLLFYSSSSEEVERELWRALFEQTGPDRAAVYLAHMMLRQVEWEARNERHQGVQRFLRRSHDLFGELLRRGSRI